MKIVTFWSLNNISLLQMHLSLALAVSMMTSDVSAAFEGVEPNAGIRTKRSLEDYDDESPILPQPSFDMNTERNVTVQLGNTAHLNCRILHLGTGVVAWIRKRDYRVMTVGKFTFTSDARVGSIHNENSDDWTLEIKNTMQRDAGVYDCQVSNNLIKTLSFMLNVV